MALTYHDQWNNICNKALALLGRETLVNYETDESADAELCRTFLPEAVGVAAEYFDWTFLTKHQELSPDTQSTGPASFSFTLPTDVARLSGVDTQGTSFSIMSGKVHSDSSSCTIIYIRQPSQPDGLPASFRQAVVHYLAYLLAKPLSGNDALKNEELQLFQLWIEKAATDDRSWLSDKGTAWWTEEIG